MDMLVNLYTMPTADVPKDVRIVRALPPERHKVLQWVEEHFSAGWREECAVALSAQPATCLIAQKDGACIGFACYDATAKGYFGPIGVADEARGSGVGRALLIRCLEEMRSAGYGYAAIGWCNEAASFYSRAVGAIPIPGSEPEHTVYSRLTRFSKKD
ncbi:MAG: GNAT family N-acetyltransferase [Clostridia bacterium]|nr:GNAT family N-acetyltransferase [Clostridia bacterium]